MKVTPLAIPDVLLIEPKVFGDDRGFFTKASTKKLLKTRRVLMCNSFRIITQKVPRTSCVDCITSCRPKRRGNSCALLSVKYLMLQLIFGRVLRRLASGLVKYYLLITNGNYGFLQGLLMASSFLASRPRFFTRPLTTMHLSLNAAFYGMTMQLPLIGRSLECLFCRARISRGAFLRRPRCMCDL